MVERSCIVFNALLSIVYRVYINKEDPKLMTFLLAM